jgi:hypothetical protein
MKRTPLTRRTPLEAKTPLKRTTAVGSNLLVRSALHKQSAANQRQPKRARRDTGPSVKTVALVWRRDAGCCVRCGKQCVFAERGTDWSLQHRRARGMGGTRRPDTNSPQSLIVLCGSATTGCHGWVESNRTVALSNGWAVKSNSDPLLIPVAYRGSHLWLTDDGDLTTNPYAKEAS